MERPSQAKDGALSQLETQEEAWDRSHNDFTHLNGTMRDQEQYTETN
jgi:hypothetical protein